MSLDEIIAEVETQFNAFQAKGVLDSLIEKKNYGTIQAAIDATIAAEKEHRETARDAVDQFVEQGSWPVLMPQPQLVIFEILSEAMNFLQTMKRFEAFGANPLRFDPAATRRDIVAYLLIDYWMFVGRARWIGRQFYPLT